MCTRACGGIGSCPRVNGPWRQTAMLIYIQAAALVDLAEWTASNQRLCGRVQHVTNGLCSELLLSTQAARQASAAARDACEAMHALLRAAAASGEPACAIADATALLAYAHRPGRRHAAQAARLQRLVASVRRGTAVSVAAHEPG